MKRILLVLTIALSSYQYGKTQNFSSRSNIMSMDYSDPKNSLSSTLAKIEWQTPVNETVFLKEGTLTVELTVTSKTQLKSARLIVRDKLSNEEKGSTFVSITDEKKLFLKVSKNLTLTDGINEVLIEVENRDGVKSISKREVHVG